MFLEIIDYSGQLNCHNRGASTVFHLLKGENMNVRSAVFLSNTNNTNSPWALTSPNHASVGSSNSDDAQWPTVNTIATKDTINYVDSPQTVCGTVAQVTDFSIETYLNLNKRFPNTFFATVIWDSDIEKVLGEQHSFHRTLDRQVCVSGKITSFNNRAKIVVKNSG